MTESEAEPPRKGTSPGHDLQFRTLYFGIGGAGV
jgi:hypothetical protein